MWFRRYLLIGNSLRRFNKRKNIFLLRTTFCTQGLIKITCNMDSANNRIRYLFKALFFFNNSNLSTYVFAFVFYSDLRLLIIYFLHNKLVVRRINIRNTEKVVFGLFRFYLSRKPTHTS